MYTELEEKLGYTFKNAGLLNNALVHQTISLVNNNEKLEFMGDGVLYFVATQYVIKKFPTKSVGELSRIRSSFIRKESLYKLSQRFDLNRWMKYFDVSKGIARESMLADGVEALIAAIYLDCLCVPTTYAVMERHFEELHNAGDIDFSKDPKTLLQEILQANGFGFPTYETHASSTKEKYGVSCKCAGREANGFGITIKIAQMEAAKKMITVLRG